MSSRLAPWPFPFWIAHRGAGKLAPENTLAAFRLGAEYGWRAFECDVKLSADDLPFLLHDATLERTTNRSGAAADLPWRELSTLDAGGWHSRRFAGEPPASLQGLAAFLMANHFVLDLEIKPSPGRERHTGEVVGVWAERLWAKARPDTLFFTSFRPEALAGARATAPGIPRGLLLDSLQEGWLEQAQALACAAVITRHTLMDAALVARLHANGLRALVYTVNEPDEAHRLQSLGIDGIVTDAVDRFAPL